MMMMCATPNGLANYFAGKYPKRIGLMVSPRSTWQNYWWIPWALDNGAYTGFDEEKFKLYLMKAQLCRSNPPLWVAVPDVVADPEKTMEMWHDWVDVVWDCGFRPAFVAQDGMEPQDIPNNAECVFVGGTTDWKLRNAHRFKGVSPWLHIGRVNTLVRLKWCEEIEADSADGTGWFRAGYDNPEAKQLQDLVRWFEGSDEQQILFPGEKLFYGGVDD